ncbi:CotH kinase family protein [Mucilaginibacter auburnensis]|uniref:CotH protein n=1 Tax=Mucilaginibacter auburnensis TaxID=1457233 RepID=A0A2H9VNM9_9SPHI|nr:CotH kinase family protein [Mucilaginibacter auburnensis]PJJ79910.1 CotH protein [Mucilaginibacter auburnensis]
MRRTLLLLFVIATGLWACKKTNYGGDNTLPTVDSAGLTSFKIEAKNNSGKITADVNCTITGDSIIAVVPQLTRNKKWVITFETKKSGTIVKANDTLQVSGNTSPDFSQPVTYKLTSASGLTQTYKVKIKAFTGLPILYITTDAPVVSKDAYVNGVLNVDANAEYDQPAKGIALQMKGRGNSTWYRTDFLKKPYRLKFNSKAPLLGMPTAKNWVLLANYSDKTLMRTKIAFELARRVKSDYAPQSRFVEVVLNGDFIGNYLLTSQVEINENRVNLTPLSASNITGGYLFELDAKLDADAWFRTPLKNTPLTFKDPDAPTPAQLAYLKDYVTQTEAALFSADWTDADKGYAKYIDAESFMRWYFVNETIKNQDSWDYSSIYYYKNANSKIGMGPVWDFDLSGGNCDYSVAKDFDGWYTRNGTWMLQLAKDPAWNFKFRAMWTNARQKEIKQMFDDIDYYGKQLQLSAAQNYKRWPTLDQYVWPNVVWLGSYDKEVAYFKNFMTQRVAWIDANINSY